MTKDEIAKELVSMFSSDGEFAYSLFPEGPPGFSLFVRNGNGEYDLSEEGATMEEAMEWVDFDLPKIHSSHFHSMTDDEVDKVFASLFEDEKSRLVSAYKSRIEHDVELGDEFTIIDGTNTIDSWKYVYHYGGRSWGKSALGPFVVDGS